jgi:hypothetical protein
METSKTFENYPIRIVTLSNVVSFGIYILGFIIIYQLGLIPSIIYLGFILALEYRLIRYSCTNCYYWGKTCGFRKGRLSALFFKKGDPLKFCNNVITWKYMIPDLLVSLIPLAIGIILLIIKFEPLILFALVLLVALTTAGNGYIRGTLTCTNCKQRELGCPADKLFNKGK